MLRIGLCCLFLFSHLVMAQTERSFETLFQISLQEVLEIRVTSAMKKVWIRYPPR